MTHRESFHKDPTIDEADVAKFDRLGADWWDPKGSMRALHKLNPVRVAYLRERLCVHFSSEKEPRDWRSGTPLAGLRLIDIGCGAGLLCEPLARLGASITGIDPSSRNIEVACHHAARGGLSINYRCITTQAAAAGGEVFDAVLAMEVIEHVRDLREFLRHAAALVRPGGLVALATLNRTLKSFAFAIVGAEYILRWLPPGTHNWRQFITPLELAAALRSKGLRIEHEAGLIYDPVSSAWRLSHDMDVNYMMIAGRAGK